MVSFVLIMYMTNAATVPLHYAMGQTLEFETNLK